MPSLWLNYVTEFIRPVVEQSGGLFCGAGSVPIASVEVI
jgi:hypothetical protein